jgi:KUP system potassium uptake protein
MKPQKLTAGVMLGAMGVVYGDIGTSPLYALETALKAAGGLQGGRPALLGVLSLMFWSIAIVVTLKYVVLMMRADNAGEGGILSLYTLIQRQLGEGTRWVQLAAAMAVLGAALFYCDALITPAISVLSAVEGFVLLDPDAERVVIPVTLGIIFALFLFQKRGTERVGRLFGPIMLVWFGTLALTGLVGILREPSVLAAANPLYGLNFLFTHPGLSSAVLGGVFLTMTGGEALYTDMGHFGKQPVRIVWLAVIWPALLLSYFGQGALILTSPTSLHMPLFMLLPPALLPLFIVLATAATIIASQAVITGAFSVTRQAIQLDLLPRLRILQTSAHEHGQIYIPLVNNFLFVAVCCFVLGFGSSAALSATYGAAVACTMLIEGSLAAIVASVLWRWRTEAVAGLFGLLFLVDLTFLISNLSKFRSGAWIPLLLATLMFTLFMTWRSGRQQLRRALRLLAVPLGELPQRLASGTRVPGTAVYLVSDSRFIPTALLRNLEHNHVAHEQIVIMNIEIVRAPRQVDADRVRINKVFENVTLLTARFGFMETPDVGEAIKQSRNRGLKLFAQDCSFFLGWHLLRPRPRRGYRGLQNRVFAWLQQRSAQAAEFFHMPERRVIVLATPVEF